MISLKNVTIVIPTYNCRNHFLHRVLDYYQSVEVNILVVDSNDVELLGHDNYKNVQYLFFPSLPFSKKIARAFERVSTPYVVLCADDDFIVPHSIHCCVEFLENNPDYCSAQGNYVHFFDEPDCVASPLYFSLKHNISSDTLSKRMEQCMHVYMHHYYAVHRTNNLKYFFQDIHSQLPTRLLSLGEVSLTIFDAINGKHKILPIFYAAREAIKVPIVSSSPSVVQIFTDVNFDPELRKKSMQLLDLLVEHYCRVTGSDQIEGKQQVNQTMDYYLNICRDRENTMYSMSSFLQKLKHGIYKLLRPYMPNRLLNYRYNCKVNYWKNFPGYPFSEGEAKKEWDRIKGFIAKHH